MLTPAEAKRKLLHMAAGGLALLLRFMTWRQAVLMVIALFFFNWQALPRLGGRGLWRETDHDRGFSPGILLYPLAVLGLILAFHDELWKAAAVWAVMAAGDGMAAFFGLAAGGPGLAWNRDKTWAGSVAFAVFGTIAGSVLMVWTLRLPLAAWASPRVLAVTLPVALVCALVESMPTTLDDNVTVPVVGAAAIVLFSQAEPARLLHDPDTGPRLFLGLALNGAVAVAARYASLLDTAGAVSTAIIGAAITVGLGLAGLLVMATFFVLGSTATRFGYARKAARGIAQEPGGARGWRSVWANGGVPALLALLAATAPPELGAVYTLAYAGAVAAAAADTCASEIGKGAGGATVLLATRRRVEPGTEGGTSGAGTMAGIAAATLVAASGTTGRLYAWAAVPLVAAAGALGSLVESLVGPVAEPRGWLGNHALNVLNTCVGAALAALFLFLVQ